MKPMLARTVGARFAQYPCYVQPKLNGVRALYQNGVWQSRDEKIWAPAVLAHLTDRLRELAVPDSMLLDGELYVHGWRLQQINGAVAVNRSAPRADTTQVCFHIFDVVAPERKFSSRWFEVYHGLPASGLVVAVPTALAHSWTEVEQHFHLYTREGYEGIMLRPDGIYEPGEHLGRNGNQTTFRSKFLWKHKHWEDDEWECVGFTPGEGKAEIGIGALTLTTMDHSRHFGVGTGFTDRDRVEFSLNPPIGRQVRVRYLCLTADGVPFNPSFIAVL